jgi:hypothetical protein
VSDKKEDNSWFKKFMGMPEPGDERREKIQMWVTIIIAFAVILGAVYLVGCKGECIRACQDTMEACFESVKTSEEREQCMTNNAACVRGCNESGTRIHWEVKEKKDPAADTMDDKKKAEPAPPKEPEKPVVPDEDSFDDDDE